MAKLSILAGSTSKLLKIFIQNSSVSTGAGLTGLVFNSGSLIAYYIREGDATATVINLVTATVGTFTSSGFKEVDSAHMPGVYELGIPNAAIASGAKSVLVMLSGATNMAPCLLELELTATDNQNATTGGLAALPNANAGANGGLPTVDANNSVKLQSGTSANQISLSSGLVTVGTNNDKTGYSLATGQIAVKKNVALNNFSFLMVSSTDHVTPQTGLTITAQRSIDGAAFAACANSATELSNGIYVINLANTDLNGTVITLKFTAATADNRYVVVVTQA